MHTMCKWPSDVSLFSLLSYRVTFTVFLKIIHFNSLLSYRFTISSCPPPPHPKATETLALGNSTFFFYHFASRHDAIFWNLWFCFFFPDQDFLTDVCRTRKLLPGSHKETTQCFAVLMGYSGGRCSSKKSFLSGLQQQTTETYWSAELCAGKGPDLLLCGGLTHMSPLSTDCLCLLFLAAQVWPLRRISLVWFTLFLSIIAVCFLDVWPLF